jgi:hypothetical protein
MNLVGVAEEIQHRIIHIFGRDLEGRRATNGGNPKLDHDPHFRDYVWFYEVGQSFSRSFIMPENGPSVLPCRQWQRLGSIASNRLVRAGVKLMRTKV